MSDPTLRQVWHVRSVDETARLLESEANNGLDAREAEDRLLIYGHNALKEQGGRSPVRIIWEQLTATMVVILIVAAVVSALLGKWLEASAILAIVVLFALLGFFQEWRAEQAMQALKQLAVPDVRVRRNGRVVEIAATNLVPGDLVVLEAGNLVPADLRLVQAINLRIQESALTGEAEAVEKRTEPLLGEDLPLGDRRNLAYMGSTIAYGRGMGMVVATGMQTELGNIAGLLQQEGDEQTPLQKRLDQVGKVLAVAGIITAVVVGAFGLWRGQPLVDVFLTGVSIAVAVVPEGLPAVVTITLALGARRMLARNALIRRLPAVETLGSVTVICSDKTGTLTENRMTVTVLDVAGHRIDLSEETNEIGQAQYVVNGGDNVAQPAIRLLLLGGALCNDAQLVEEGTQPGQRFHAIGDPTEGALVVAAAKYGLDKAMVDSLLPRRMELPFDSERKRMTTVHQFDLGGHSSADGQVQPSLLPTIPGQTPNHWIAFTKGSVDGLLDISTHVWADGAMQPLDSRYRMAVEESIRSLAQNGMRVLGVGFRLVESDVPRVREEELVFVGMVGIMDPPRPEVKAAVARCREAGIRPVMITGDHPLTAAHIARELGIAMTDSKVLTGVDLERMEAGALDAEVEQVSVYARVSPEHKLRIVEALERRGHVVAMTGDGVNDAPALKHADIGVAMGITGTDVSKEAADMVLRDDNFATIVAAVEEGRTIFDNLRKFIKFSIGGNIGKIVVMVGGIFLGMTTPLLPLQLLWLNLLTDGLLGIGLGVEPAERNIMRRPPFSPQAGIFSGGLGAHMVQMGLTIGIVGLALGGYAWYIGHTNWQTMLFTTLAFAQVWQVMGIRSNHVPIWRLSPLTNLPLLGLIAAVILLQLGAIYLPWLNTFLGTQPLTQTDLLLCVGVSAVILVVAELEKAWTRHARPAAALTEALAEGALVDPIGCR